MHAYRREHKMNLKHECDRFSYLKIIILFTTICMQYIPFHMSCYDAVCISCQLKCLVMFTRVRNRLLNKTHLQLEKLTNYRRETFILIYFHDRHSSGPCLIVNKKRTLILVMFKLKNVVKFCKLHL